MSDVTHGPVAADRSELDRQGLATLEAGPRWCLPMAEVLRRGIGHVLAATPASVCLALDNGDIQIWADSSSEVRRVLEEHPAWEFVMLAGPGLGQEVCKVWGLPEGRIEFFSVAAYTAGTPLPVSSALEIRTLGVEWAETVRDHYTHPEFFPIEEIRRRCAAGTITGGFEDGELVGYIGSHAEGSMGMLEVFEGHRHQGYATALESAKIDEHLSHGWTPWAQIFADNVASINLQHKLGLSLTPADEQCFLSIN
ncbi:MAG: GNAT family N-acetyltransferase [Atopobiaceae bacterium]|jgi:GNAT superfamily N-acetyltransferase|nr:GNAT family N-acetyltransferase [Atopobiaceae bacterium]MCH4214613.1 GNAT family N-acetyltransferase [Atopobiaceae bacterium]MCH4275792.1 GNAT family N-acetyltransferase [Atopobiaceae bacterium]MCI1225844.1 GNAT family N-acetyltransferase [Atopobiaceae bacterium]MCI1260566.1 GNAT family N-acetyltransferase [Atopobiaceae bacterium]